MLDAAAPWAELGGADRSEPGPSESHDSHLVGSGTPLSEELATAPEEHGGPSTEGQAFCDPDVDAPHGQGMLLAGPTIPVAVNVQSLGGQQDAPPRSLDGSTVLGRVGTASEGGYQTIALKSTVIERTPITERFFDPHDRASTGVVILSLGDVSVDPLVPSEGVEQSIDQGATGFGLLAGSTQGSGSEFGSGANVTIPTTGTVYKNITSSTPSGATINDAKFRFKIIHSWLRDLDVWLVSPRGTSRQMWNNYGYATDNGYDDDSADDGDIYFNRYNVRTWNGENPNGTWRLKVTDRYSGDGGYIDYFYMTLFYSVASPADLEVRSLNLDSTPWQWGRTAQVDYSVKNYGDQTGSAWTKLIVSNDTRLWDGDDHVIFDDHVTLGGGSTWSRTNRTFSMPSSPWPGYDRNDTLYVYVHVGSPFDDTYYRTTSVEAFQPSFSGVSESGWVDQDGDGYVREFDFNFSVSSNISGEYLVKVYDEYGTYLGNTGYQSINGSDNSSYEVDISDHGSLYGSSFRDSSRDYSAVLYDTTNRSSWRYVTTWTKSNDSTLGYKWVESDLQDSFSPIITSVEVVAGSKVDTDNDTYPRELDVRVGAYSEIPGNYSVRLYNRNWLGQRSQEVGSASGSFTRFIFPGDLKYHTFRVSADRWNFGHGTQDLVAVIWNRDPSPDRETDDRSMNNVKFEKSSEDEPADLIATSYNGPGGTVIENRPAWIKWQIRNNGDAAAPTSHAHAWLSDVKGSREYYLGVVSVPSLAANSSTWVQWGFNMPNIGSGVYGVHSVVELDIDNDVNEGSTGENNNAWETTNAAFQTSDPFEPSFDKVSLINRVDRDGDGFARSFEVKVDVDAGATSGSVKIAFYKDVPFWFNAPLGSTSAFSVSGTDDDYHHFVVDAEALGLSCGTFDMRMDLVDAATGQVVQIWTGEDDPDLSGISAELASQDAPFNASIFDARWRSLTDVNGNGKARRGVLEVDADSNIAGTVYLTVVQSESGRILGSSGHFAVEGYKSDWQPITIDADLKNLTQAEYDLTVELRRAGTDQLVATRTHAVDTDLASVGLELSSQDVGFAAKLSGIEVPTSSVVDVDTDRFWPQFDVRIGVEATSGSGQVCAKVRDQTTGAYLGTTGPFSLSGSSVAWRTATIVVDDVGLPRSTRDLDVQLFDAATNWLLQTWTAADDVDLRVNVEPSAHDFRSDTPGDTLATVQDLGTINAGQTVGVTTEQIGDSAYGNRDVDLYHVVLAAYGTLTVDVTTPGSSLDGYIRLFDSVGNELDSSGGRTGSNGDLMLTTTLAAGRYHIGISSRTTRSYDPNIAGSGSDGSTGTYRMAVAFQSQSNPTPVELADPVLEYLSKGVAYANNWTEGMAVGVGDYVVDRVFSGFDGFYALGLVSDTQPAVLAIRGTDTGGSADMVMDLIADANPTGVGYSQFQLHRDEVLAWLSVQSSAGNSPYITGHSLGGALAQWFAVEATSRKIELGDVVSWNAPGIDDNFAARLDPTYTDDVTHYIASGDFVSMAGEAYIEGGWYLAEFDEINFVDTHTGSLLDSDYHDPDWAVQLTYHDDVDWLNHALFTFADADYYAYVAAAATVGCYVPSLAPIAPAMLFRGSVEQSRQAIGGSWDQLTNNGHWSLSINADGFEVGVARMHINVFDLVEIEATGLKAAYTDSTDTVRLYGQVTLPSVFNATASFLESDGNFIEIRQDGWDVKGVLSVEDIKVHNWGLDELVLDIDTLAHQVTGTVSVAIPSIGSVEGTIGFDHGKLNHVYLGAGHGTPLNLAIGSTGAFLQSIGGGVNHLSDPLPVAFSGDAGVTYGPQIDIDLPWWWPGDDAFEGYLIRLDVNGEVDASHLHGDGTLSFVGGLAEATGFADVNWVEGTLDAGATFGFIPDLATPQQDDYFLEADFDFSANASLDITASGDARVTLPSSIPLWGGRELASAGGYFQFRNDSGRSDFWNNYAGWEAEQDWSNDFFAFWGDLDMGFLGTWTKGFSFAFDGSFDWIGAEEIEAYRGTQHASLVVMAASGPASETFFVAQDTPWAMMEVRWDNANTSVPIRLELPDGTVLSQDDMASGDIRIMADLSDDHHTVIGIDSPTAGRHRLIVNDTAGLGAVQFYALGGATIPLPFVTIDAPATDVSNGTVDIRYAVHNADMGTILSLFYDGDRVGYDGVEIASMDAVDGPGIHSWCTESLPTGSYYIYGMIIDDDGTPFLSDYSTGRVNVVAAGAPAEVTGLRVSSSTDTSITLVWDASPDPDLDYYLVRYTKMASGETYEHGLSTSVNQITLAELAAGEICRMTVAAVDTDSHVGADADPIAVVIGAEAAVAPAAGAWSIFASPGETYVAKVPGATGSTYEGVSLHGGALDAFGNFTWDVSGSETDGWHEVVVKVTAPEGGMTLERFWLLVDGQSPRWAGSGPVASVGSSTSLTVTAPPLVDATGVPEYRLRRNGAAIGGWQLAPVFADTGLAPNTTYTYEIQSRDASPNRWASAWSSPTTVCTHAGVPGMPTFGDTTPSSIMVAAVDAGLVNPAGTEYAIFNATLGTWIGADGSASDTKVWQGAAAWAGTTVTCLEADTAYDFQSVARNADGIESGAGCMTSTRTARETAPPTVTYIGTQPNGDTTLAFSEPVSLAPIDVAVMDAASLPLVLNCMTLEPSTSRDSVTVRLNGALESGDYTLRLRGPTVQDLAGNQLDGNGDGVGGDDFEHGFTVTDGNEQATDLGLSSNAVAENQPLGTQVGAFSTIDPDVGDTHTYSLIAGTGGADNGSFTIQGEALRTAASFDYEATNTYSIRVRSVDQGGLYAEKVFAINVANVNEQPVDITLSNSTVHENSAAGTVVGVLSTSDPDVGETFAYSLVGGTGGDDNGLFTIVQTNLATVTSLDYETGDCYGVRVRSTDQGGLSTEQGFTITVTDVNEPPTVSLGSITSTLFEDTDTSNSVKVADIVVTDDALGAETLSLSGADAASFRIVSGNELHLKAGTALDFETNPVLDVTVEVDDTSVGATPDDTASLSVMVTDVNEAPTVALANTTTTLPEDTDTTSSMKVADIVVSDDALGTNTLSLSGADAALFEVVGTELHLKAGAMLDFETNAALDVTVEVDDISISATPDEAESLSISVTDVNEAPTVALGNPTTALPEDTDTTSGVKVADIVVTDDALGAETLSLSGADAAIFEIVGSELHLKAGATLDFETNRALDVTVAVEDTSVGGTPDDTASLSIPVTDVNEPPTVVLTNTTTTLPEDTDTVSSVKVADIVVADDALGTNGLSLSGADAALFEIVGNKLHLKAGATLDFETNPALDVTVQADDVSVDATPDDTAALSIAVIDVNEPPAVSLANPITTLPEDTDTTSSVKVAGIVVSDDALGTNTLSLSGADAALFEVVGTELHLKAGATLDFETSPALDVTVQVDDTSVGATPDDAAALSIAVTDVNEPPTVALANPITTLPEDTDTTSSVKVAGIVVSDDALGTNTLSLSGADAALFEVVGTELHLKAGATLDFETSPALDVTVQVDDTSVGATPDDAAALSIAVTDVNEPPTVALANPITALPEDTETTSSVKVADIVVSDDALGTNGLSLTGADAALFGIVGGNELHLKAGATLDFETSPALDVTVQVDDTSVGTAPDDTASLSITVTDVNERPMANNDSASTDEDHATVLAALLNDTDPDASDTLRVDSVDTSNTQGSVAANPDGTLTYDPNGQFESLAVGQSGTDTFGYTVSDTQGATDTAVVTVTISGANDAPVALGGAFTVNEDESHGGAVTATDVDNGATWTYHIVAGPSHGAISGFDSQTGGFTYAPSHNYCGPDSFTFRANDGRADSNVATVAITVAPVNDAPVIDGLPDKTFDEDSLVAAQAGQTWEGEDVLRQRLGYDRDTVQYLGYDGDAGLAAGAGPTGDVTPTGSSYLAYEYWGGDWVDAEKSPTNGEDDLMCWAAAAANVLEWTGWGQVDGMTDTDDMFEYFQDHWTDEGGIMQFGWDWWFDGTNASQGWNDWSQVDVAGGGFYPSESFFSHYRVQSNDSLALAAVDQYLHAGYGVAIGVYNDPYGHAITSWGVNYNPDDPSDYYGIWVTDSDDSKRWDDPADRLRYYEVEEVSGRWYLQGFYGSDDWHIGVVQALANAGNRIDLWECAWDVETADEGLTFSIVGNTDPSCGVSIHGNRYVLIDPEADWYGISDVTIQVTDGQLTDTDTFRITVNPVNDQPVAQDDAVGTDEDVPVVIDVLHNDADVDGDALNVHLLTDPAHGTASVNPDGTITYSPDSNFHGTDAFSYAVSDGNGGTDTATASIAIREVNDLPIGNTDLSTTDEDTAITLDALANDSDADAGDVLRIASVNTTGTLVSCHACNVV